MKFFRFNNGNEFWQQTKSNNNKRKIGSINIDKEKEIIKKR